MTDSKQTWFDIQFKYVTDGNAVFDVITLDKGEKKVTRIHHPRESALQLAHQLLEAEAQRATRPGQPVGDNI